MVYTDTFKAYNALDVSDFILCESIRNYLPINTMYDSSKTDFKTLLASWPEFLKYLEKQEPTFRQKLLREVDENNFSLTDWVESLILLDRWLDTKGLTLSSTNRLGYVSCAAKSVGDGSSLSHLPSVVEEFLKQYGCELAVKK